MEHSTSRSDVVIGLIDGPMAMDYVDGGRDGRVSCSQLSPYFDHLSLIWWEPP